MRKLLVLLFATCMMGLAVCACARNPPLPASFVPTRAIQTLSAKEKATLNNANYEKIKEGMSQDEVRAIFGTSGPSAKPRTEEDEYELVWKYGDEEIAVRFRGHRSVSKSRIGVEP